jgi:murein DD-endopeptidase MepM/ murein hydrolase activator NlpD
MSSYAKGMEKGARVQQGDTIGYVGATGLTTGPHLHYEVIYQGVQINPATVKFPQEKNSQKKMWNDSSRKRPCWTGSTAQLIGVPLAN